MQEKDQKEGKNHIYTYQSKTLSISFTPVMKRKRL